MKSPQRMERKGSKRNTRCDSVRNSQWFHRLVLTLNPRPELWQTSIISESQVMWGEKVKKNYGFKLIRVVVSLALLKSSRKEEETINRILKEIFCSQTNPTPLTSKESKKRGRGMEKWKTEKKKNLYPNSQMTVRATWTTWGEEEMRVDPHTWLLYALVALFR